MTLDRLRDGGAGELLQFLGLGHLRGVTEFTVRAKVDSLIEVEVTMFASHAPEEFRTRRFKVQLEEVTTEDADTLLQILEEEGPPTAADPPGSCP